MEPTVQPNSHLCATCIAFIGYPNGKPELRRSRLNIWLVWALSVGEPLMWRANYPKVPDRDSPRMADRHATVRAPRVTYFIGDRGSDKEPGVGQTTGGVSKPVCLESRYVHGKTLQHSTLFPTSRSSRSDPHHPPPKAIQGGSTIAHSTSERPVSRSSRGWLLANQFPCAMSRVGGVSNRKY